MEMEEVKEDEGNIPQDEQMQEHEEEPDYAESELSGGAMLRANEIANSEMIDIMALESEEDAVLDPRPRIANKVMARFLNSMMRNDLGRIDAMLQSEREARERFHQQRREEEQRHERASASGHLPSGETPDVPGSSGHLPSGEIPDVPNEQEMKKEQNAIREPSDEVKIYQEELGCRKSMDIFAQPSSAEFMKLLQPGTENLTSENQVKMEGLSVEKGIKKTNRPFQNKMPESINQPLEKEPRVKVVIPKPEPRGEDQEQTDYRSALDGLSTLDKQNKSKYFGFYGRDFRWSHDKALNFLKFRKATIEHPRAKFDEEVKRSVLRLVAICSLKNQHQRNIFTRRRLFIPVKITV